MRIAGRNPEGLAKALKVDLKGALETKLTGGDKSYLMQIGAITTGKNLFNKEDATLNRAIISTGASSAEPGWYHTGFITVFPGSTIVFNQLIASSSAGTAFYKDGVFKKFFTNAEIRNNNNKIVVPSGVNEMRSTTSMGATSLEVWQIEVGEVSTGYEKYSEYSGTSKQVEKLEHLILQTERSLYSVGKNTFNKATATMGHYINQNGIIEVSTSWIATDFIPVYPGEKFYFRSNGSLPNGMNTSLVGGTAFFDVGKKFISWVSNTAIVGNNGIVEVPNNAFFMRSSGALSDINEWQITTDDKNPSVYEPYKVVRFGNSSSGVNVSGVDFNFAYRKDGTKAKLTSEEDNDGNSVLRVVDAAPYLSEITSFNNVTHKKVSVTSVSVLAIETNAARKSVLLENISEEPLFLSFGSNAELGKGIRLAANEKYEITAMKGNLYKGDIYAIGSATHDLLVSEGYL